MKNQKRGQLAIGFVLLVAIIAAALWIERIAIAARFARAELDTRGVRATYVITTVGPRTQRIENLVIGDPAHPDLSANWVEIDLKIGFSGVVVDQVRARGIRLVGRMTDKMITFGALDKLLPAPDGTPFALPDIGLDVTSMLVGIATPAGAIGAVISGTGSLAGGFTGKAVTSMPVASLAGCEARSVHGTTAIKTRARRIGLAGPIRAQSVICGKNVARAVMMIPDMTFAEGFDRWNGKVYAQTGEIDAGAVTARATTIGGKQLSYAIAGSAVFAGDARTTRGRVALASNSIALAALGEGALALRATYRVSPELRTATVTGGEIISSRFTIDQQAMAPLRGIVASADGSPVAPVAKALGEALVAASRGARLAARFDAQVSRERTSLAVRDIVVASGRDIAIRTARGKPVTLVLPEGRFAFDTTITLAGGKTLPSGRLQITGNQTALKGQVTALAYRTKTAAISLAPIVFDYRRRGWSAQTVATIDGPLGSGRIAALRVPLALRNGRLVQSCLPVTFDRLVIAALTLLPTRLDMCVRGDQVLLGATRVAGRIGGNPLSLSAAAARFGVTRSNFGLDGVSLRLGSGDRISNLRLSSLSGAARRGGFGGAFEGAAGTIGGVPLALSEGGGQWQYMRDMLTLGGALRIADTQPAARFLPLVSNDVALQFANNRITARALLREPKSGTAVATVDLDHNVQSAAGQAVLDVAGITFGPRFQPEALTPITLGVVANVIGSVAGRGVINWDGDQVSSTGSFRTDALDFAAAFGPVSGLKGEIALSDLLGLETAPGQQVSLASVNPGIAVTNGVVAYRLLPELKIQIEGGRWPFSGGSLILEPTILDLSEAATRRLTFRVEGLDAAKFINQLEFQNIAATGIFDGTLPMIFDASGGRIEGGRLTARGGGTLSYVGEISNENLGTMGQFAFDALKSIKYDRLAIDLGGAIDGDIVTKVSFAGVNQAPITAKRTKLPIRIVGINNIPFIFNVTITAPFRQLFETTKSLQDPSALIERIVPQLQKPPAPKQISPVQTKESEPVR